MSVTIHRGTSPSWEFAQWSPPRLTRFVDHLWAFVGPTANPRKRIFPNGCVELLINLGDPYVALGETTERLPGAWVTGPLTGPLLIGQPPRQRCLGVRLRPLGARMLLAHPLREMTNASIELGDLIGEPMARRLVEQCDAVCDPAAQLHLVARWLQEQLARRSERDRAIAWAISALDASAGNHPVTALRKEIGLSEARFVARFQDAVGLTPKVYSRVVRFRRVLMTLQAEGATPLAALALGTGFYDQPHMNGEFRRFAGMTPREFVAARHPVGDGSTARG